MDEKNDGGEQTNITVCLPPLSAICCVSTESEEISYFIFHINQKIPGFHLLFTIICNMFPDFTENLASYCYKEEKENKSSKKSVCRPERSLDKISELLLTVPPTTSRLLSAPVKTADQLRKLSNFSCRQTSPSLR